MPKQARGSKILIADDEPQVVDLVQMVLQMEGYTVVSADNGEKALVSAQTEDPDLILLDVRMPKLSGLAVLERLGADAAMAVIPVIVLSVVTTYPEVRTALERGAIAYLPKPFELQEMSRLVGRILAMDGVQRQTYRQQALNSIGTKW